MLSPSVNVGSITDPTSKTRHRKTEVLFGHKLEEVSSPCNVNRIMKASNNVSGLHTICPYYTMFPLEFPLKSLIRAGKNDWIFDPFCGRGTTLFAARLLGLGSVGIDSNPVAAAISSAKLVDTDVERVINLLNNILSSKKEPEYIPQGAFWDSCYHQKTLYNLCALREQLLVECSTPEAVMLRALILGILHGPLRKGRPTYLSNQMPRTFSTKPEPAIKYWHKNDLMVPPYVDLRETLQRRVKFSISKMPEASPGEVFLGDARKSASFISERYRFNWVITSPPYFGMRSYRPDQWLRNWFLGGISDVDYNHSGELLHTRKSFTLDLAKVWREVAAVCSPGARLIVRFGSLPSEPVDAVELLKQSLNDSNAGWRVLTRKNAGTANSGNRQAKQFSKCGNISEPEFDLYARLEV